MNTTIIGIVLLFVPAILVAIGLTILFEWLCRKYLGSLIRIFVEKPLFIIPRGQRPEDAEDLRIPTSDGLTLAAAYLKTTAPQRKGVILFGLEFGANRWSCVPYCEQLLAAGYDIFTYEPRNQGDSDAQADYEPLQWITDRDVADCSAALSYLKSRHDAVAHGVGFFGVSKGGSAGLAVAADDPYIRCVLTDGAFATYSVMIPYMRHWFSIYNQNYIIHGLVKPWYYGLLAMKGMQQAARDRNVRYIHLEGMIGKLAPRPLFMIHGEKDGYIKPSMAKRLLARAGEPKEFWQVEGAKHNQAMEVMPEEYRRRALEFFDAYLGSEATMPALAGAMA